MNIFACMDYIEILEGLIRGATKSGVKTRLAEAIGCQAAYLSRVLARTADFNTDQLLKAASFFDLSEIEKEFWMDVLQENRAGDKSTKLFFRSRAEKTLGKVQQLDNRLRAQHKISPEDQAKYYESWLYSAVHMATRIPSLQSITALSDAIGVEKNQLVQVLSDLAAMGLIELNGGKISTTSTSIHLGEDSTWVTRHHMNWRHKTAEKLSRNNKAGLHYSSVISCSREDLAKIHESFVEIIKKTRKTVSASADEVLGHYSLDLYKLTDSKVDLT